MDETLRMSKAEVTAVEISYVVNRTTVLWIHVGEDGQVQRFGDGEVPSGDLNTYEGRAEESLFQPLQAKIRNAWLEHPGAFVAQELPGDEIILTVTFLRGPEERVGIQYKYGSLSDGAPANVRDLVATALDLTDPWYEGQRITLALENRPWTKLQLEEGEKPMVLEWLLLDKTRPFAMAVTDRALHLLERKKVAVRDPWTFRRVALSKIMEVRRKRIRRWPAYLLAALMVVVGGLATLAMVAQVFGSEDLIQLSLIPPALLAGGLVLPFLVQDRHRFVIRMTDGKYSWKPPLFLGKENREAIRESQLRLLGFFRERGVKVSPEPAPQEEARGTL